MIEQVIKYVVVTAAPLLLWIGVIFLVIGGKDDEDTYE